MKHLSDLKPLIYQYFELNHCQVEETNDTMKVNLTKELDQLLMNRPFYWHYQDMMKQEGVPARLNLVFSPLDHHQKTSLVQLGTDVFQKIYSDTLEKGQFTHLYQIIRTDKQTPLYPWLHVNIKLTFYGDHHHQEMHSLAIDLIKGTIIDHAFDQISAYSWSNQISDFCYALTPFIRIYNGYERIIQCLTEQLSYRQHSWAKRAFDRLKAQLDLIEHPMEQSNQDLEKEVENIRLIYQPTITFDIINCGLFYCHQFIASS